MQTAYIALGSNLGDRLARLQQAVAELRKIDLHLRCSPVYESAAHTLRPSDESPDFLNAVVELHTDLEVGDLLDYCQEIERKANRCRRTNYAPRTLDLDILILGNITCNIHRITLPHPRLHERRFVLQPWYDLAPDSYIPSPVDATVAEVLAHCNDQAILLRSQWLLMTTLQENVSRTPIPR
ncbi:MAG: 2-amino-4-hydroxy-6-hydroxymethyldihydropteridine diphosphokinase [Bacteroidota bacterium]|nr:2-amino-4-hydroxy-6-hydroxymethyldihydropteridine diphosphokinase [Bacteroidota bacterium]MDE2646201.1 2-amino-4-hydroxy-6-hydroxymethyldihydropteridine diphosphokinase [Bacteroidota bacterium]